MQDESDSVFESRNLPEDVYEQIADGLNLGQIIDPDAEEPAAAAPPVEEEAAEIAEEVPTPRSNEILNLAKREKALREREKLAEKQLADAKSALRQEILNEIKHVAVKNPAKFYAELGLEGKRGQIAQDLWYEELPEDDRPQDYKQKRYVQSLEEQIQELRGLIEQKDPAKYVQEMEAVHQERAYRAELSGLAKNSSVIDSVFGDGAQDALWETARTIYQRTEIVPTAAEVVEALETELRETYQKLGGVIGSSSSSAPSSKQPSKTLSTSDTPRTRRRGITEQDILREAEDLVAPYLK